MAEIERPDPAEALKAWEREWFKRGYLTALKDVQRSQRDAAEVFRSGFYNLAKQAERLLTQSVNELRDEITEARKPRKAKAAGESGK